MRKTIKYIRKWFWVIPFLLILSVLFSILTVFFTELPAIPPVVDTMSTIALAWITFEISQTYQEANRIQDQQLKDQKLQTQVNAIRTAFQIHQTQLKLEEKEVENLHSPPIGLEDIMRANPYLEKEIIQLTLDDCERVRSTVHERLKTLSESLEKININLKLYG